MIRIKICGLIEPEPATIAAEAGANYLGVVFAPSRRQVSPDKAQEIIRKVRALKSVPEVVGVFVNAPIGEINRIATTCDLDWIQLSGDESWVYCREIEQPIIKTIHVSPERTALSILQEIEAGQRILSGHQFIVLLDTQVKNVYGGTGQTFDHQIAQEVTREYRVFIAGGLTLQNVDQLIKKVQPWGVDVSSGVETGGIKDSQKIRDFVQRVKYHQGSK
jgi:phosphoribosylanthranilate isomerase